MSTLLSVRDLKQHFRLGGGFLRKQYTVHAVDGISFDLKRGRRWGWWASRVAASPPSDAACSSCSSRPRAPSPSRGAISPPSARRRCAPCAKRCRWCFRILQNPSTAATPWAKFWKSPLSSTVKATLSSAAPGCRSCWQKWACRQLGGSLPPRVFRRSAPAHRHRPCHRPQAQAAGVRRGGLGPRCLGTVADRQPAAQPAAGDEPLHHLHRPRSVGGQTHLGSDCGDVSGTDRRTGGCPVALSGATPPLYPGADLRHSGAGSAQAQSAHSADRRCALPISPPSGCHFHQRCPHATELCRSKAPRLEVCDEAHHQVACHTPLAVGGHAISDNATSGDSRLEQAS